MHHVTVTVAIAVGDIGVSMPRWPWTWTWTGIKYTTPPLTTTGSIFTLQRMNRWADARTNMDYTSVRRRTHGPYMMARR